MSFKYRIAVTIFALEAILIAVVLWGTLRYAMDHVRQQAARTDEVTIRLLNDLSRTALLTDEYAELQAFIEGDHKDPRIRAVIIADAADRVIAASDVALVGSSRPATQDRPHTYWRGVDIVTRAGRSGSLAIEFSDGPHRAGLQRDEKPRHQDRRRRDGADCAGGPRHGLRADAPPAEPGRCRRPGRRERHHRPGRGFRSRRGGPRRSRLQQHGRSDGRQRQGAGGGARSPGPAGRSHVRRLRPMGRGRSSGAVQQQVRRHVRRRSRPAGARQDLRRGVHVAPRARPGARGSSAVGGMARGPRDPTLPDPRPAREAPA